MERNSMKKTRAGLSPDISPEELKKILAVNNSNFRLYTKDYLLSEEALNYKSGFYSPKGDSFSKRDDADDLLKYRKNQYKGYWKESGWISQDGKHNREGIYLSRPRAFCPKNRLPYSNDGDNQVDQSLPIDLIGTGVYIDLKWSGYQDYYDNEKYCVAGILKKSVYELRDDPDQSFSIPYRNKFEIFDHSGFQDSDISNHRFFRESGYKHGQPIGYNKIYYQSGLDPSGFLNYNFIYIPNRRITDYDLRLGTRGKNYIGPNDELNEPHNVVRYNIFFYTGELPVVYITGEANAIKRGFGFGTVYEHNNPNYILKTNSNNFKLKFTGIYGESTTKEISIFNTGNITERFYIGINNPNLVSIDQNSLPGIPGHGVWSNENQSGKRYGQIIDKIYKVGRDSNINLKLNISTVGLSPNTTSTTHINIYRITGGHEPFGNTGENNFPVVEADSWQKNKKINSFYFESIKNTGYLSEKYTLPIDIYPLTNSSKIISDNLFYQNLPSGDYKPISKLGHSFNVDPDIKNNHFNLGKEIGISFYSVGDNLKDLSVKLDTLSKIRKKAIDQP